MTVETGLRTLSDAEQPATPSEHLYDERLRSPDPDVLVEPGTPRSHPRSTSRRSAQNLSRFDSTFKGATHMIGWISDDGLWLARGDEARRLQVGAAVLAWLNPDGELVKADGAQVKTELGWAGPETMGIELDPTITYRVLYPLGGMLLPNGEAPATSRANFERGLARAMGQDLPNGLPAHPAIGA